MDAVPYELVVLVLTPLLSAVGTLFWLVIREKDRRLEDKDTQLKQVQDEWVPALDSLQSSLKQLADLVERNEQSAGTPFGEHRARRLK
jgi:hypothetical protein